MSSCERSQRFNRESVKVNIGLPLYTAAPVGREGTTTDIENTTNAWFPNKPPTAIEFNLFTVPVTTPPTYPPVKPRTLRRTLNVSPSISVSQEAIERLRRPPSHAFVHGVLSINWVLAAVGREHFVVRRIDGRLVLRKRSGLRFGEWGLKGALVEWLKGDEGVSAAEEGLVLTSEFFEKEG
jgi:hypothetical protein